MDTCEDFALWAQARLPWSKRFLTLKNGTPSSVTFYRLFRALDPKQFETLFRRWASRIMPAAVLSGRIAVDGKAIRGSADGASRLAHIVSAFLSDLGIFSGQELVGQKSNEITAIPGFLEALCLEGFLVSIDAMGCQKEIARKIVAKGGDCLLMVKGNQPGLLESVSTAFREGWRSNLPRFEHLDANPWPTRDTDNLDRLGCGQHGRMAELQNYCHGGFVAAGGCDKTSDLELRYYISSRDMTPEALSLNRRVVIHMLSLDTAQPAFSKKKLSKRQKRKIANWDEGIMCSILGVQPL